mgnify:CR=1 FL=1
MYDDTVIIHMIIVNVYVTQNLIWINSLRGKWVPGPTQKGILWGKRHIFINLWSRVLSFEANSSNHYIKYCCSNWLLKLANFFKIKHRLHEWQVATWQITGNFVAGVNKNTYIIFEYHHFKQSNLSLFQPQYSAFKLKPGGNFGYLYVIHQLQLVCLLLQVHHYGDTLTFSFVAWKEQKYELAFHTTVHYIKHKILCLV